MTQRAARPCVHSFQKPVSAAMLYRRDTVPPVPPAPALLILDSRVSAGWEMMAAATPAITPDARDTDTLPPEDIWAGLLLRLSYIFSAAIPCTAKLAMV